jgi:hypothetical protein
MNMVMRYRLAVEDMEPDRWIAWVLDFPGCFSPARTEAGTVAGAADCITTYFSWLKSHDSSMPDPGGGLETQVAETFRSFPSREQSDFIVNAFFEDDRRPLSYWDVEVALRLLVWTREDLQAAVRGITQERLNAPLPREIGGSVAGVLRHVAGAENWYFEQLCMGVGRRQLPDDPLSMLEIVRTNTKTRLPELVGDDRVLKGDGGELWSGRKVVRRTLWHERAHTVHVGRLLAHPGSGGIA